MFPLLRSDPLLPEFPPFMLDMFGSDPLLSEFPPFMLDVFEVVNSPVESPQICCHTKRMGTGHSDFAETNGSQGRHQAAMMCFSSDQATSRRWRGVNHDNFRG
jgi:hypothetical protein